ncbi:transport protein particle complex subunit [Ramicandelaber brevisporus]|nr:transport protein particle complex subunit [Ramicandelaber brevisporus]
MAASSKQLKALGDDLFKTKTDKVSSELFVLTYGALVAQLVRDNPQNPAAVNSELDRMGYNIGCRLIDDFLARAAWNRRCSDFKETAEVVAKVGFKMFLGISPSVTNWTSDSKECSLVFDENPLTDYVELPTELIPDKSGGTEKKDGLWYSNVLCGVLRGALEMVQIQAEASFVSDILHGDESTEMRLKFIRVVEEEMPAGED